MEFAFGCGRSIQNDVKDREFLTLRITSVDRQASRGESVSLPLGNRAKIGGTEKDRELVVIVRPIDRIVQAKSRKAQIGICVGGLTSPNENMMGE